MGGERRLSWLCEPQQRAALHPREAARRLADVRVSQGDLEALAMDEERRLVMHRAGHRVLLLVLCGGRADRTGAASPPGGRPRVRGAGVLAVGVRRRSRTGGVRPAAPTPVPCGRPRVLTSSAWAT